MAKLLCSHLCLFDTIVEFHLIDVKHSTTLSLESESGLCNKTLFNSQYTIYVCNGGIYHIKLKSVV